MQGTGMVGVPGTASTLFSTVRDANVNVIMISQASSEHSICFAVKQIDADRTLHCLHERYVSMPSMQPLTAVVRLPSFLLARLYSHHSVSYAEVNCW